MPTYTFYDSNTDETYDRLLSLSAREQYLADNPHITQVITEVNIVAGVGGVRNDSGWNETLSKIAEAHPTSALANRHLSKGNKEAKTAQAVERWRKSHKQS